MSRKEVGGHLLARSGDRGSPTSPLSPPSSPPHPCRPLDLLSAATPFSAVLSSACPLLALLGRAVAARAFCSGVRGPFLGPHIDFEKGGTSLKKSDDWLIKVVYAPELTAVICA
jgi:hypothetical protein